jgi:pimeloyl-ACP methyl ester carboxylesterase
MRCGVLPAMGTYVLVHGACHDGSAFDDVIEHLRQLGHEAFAPTVAGHGKNAERGVTHTRATASVVEFILQRDLYDFVLLGHSCGGSVIAKVAEVMPERIRRLIFFSAMVLRDGESIMDVWPPQNRGLIQELAAASDDDTVMLPFSFFREVFMNDADLPTARRVYEQLSPEPYVLLSERIDLARFEAMDIPRSWLMGTEDIVMPPGEWGWHPRMSSRLGLYRLVQMPGGHELMYTNPVGLAEKIVEAGRD